MGGDWTYTLDNTPDDAQGDATNALAEGDTMEDVFTARSIDGTQATVTITVSGTNDVPSAGAGSPQTLPQGSMVTLIGTGSDPDTSDSLTYAWTYTGSTPLWHADAIHRQPDHRPRPPSPRLRQPRPRS